MSDRREVSFDDVMQNVIGDGDIWGMKQLLSDPRVDPSANNNAAV